MVDELLEGPDSRQKVFDAYGIAQILGLLNETARSRDLLIEVSKMVPHAHVYVAISAAYAKLNNLSKRLEYLEKAHEKLPDSPVIWNLLGSSLIPLNQKERGLALLRKSVEHAPENPYIYSNYLFNTHNTDELDCQKLFDEHKDWAKVHAAKDYLKDHKNSSDPNRKLRIGYISPDFRIHPVGILMNPIVNLHSRDNYEVFGYSNVLVEDEMTGIFRKSFDHFRIVKGINTQKVFDMMLNDGIDILIDLAGHTGGNRLDVLALKPAPVQVSYLGYFETTGMEQVDYFLTDEQMSPPQTQQYHTEKIFYMPSTSLSYNIIVQSPDIVSSPVLKNGYITFGMYSNPSKINRKMARLWAAILNGTKDSKLKMILKDGGNDYTVSIVMDILQECGVPCDRVSIQGKMPLGEYFPAYNEVDIMLDTYPYNGGMTTCDAFWMGVPVVSLVGEHNFSRVGLSLLTAVGLDYFAAKSEDEYVKKACALAAMPESLTKIRFQIRQRMLASPLGNPKLQTKNIEDAYRQMWRRWCREK